MSTVRTTILDQATRLFAAQGFDGTSIQSIAEAVGIRKPSLLYHFPSKAALRAAVLEQIVAQWNRMLPDLMLAAAQEQRFDAVMRAITNFFLEDPDRARLLLRETLDRPDEMRTLLVKFLRPWVALGSDQLERAKEQGYVHPDTDVEAFAVQVVHLFVGGIAVMDTMSCVLDDDENARERMTREMLRFARAGLFRRTPGSTEDP